MQTKTVKSIGTKTAKTPETTAYRVRASVSDRLQETFENFLRRATIGDIYLLADTLCDYEAQTTGATEAGMLLPAVFMQQLGVEELGLGGDRAAALGVARDHREAA